jgi:tRNA A37 methylthiotransferase MiaB
MFNFSSINLGCTKNLVDTQYLIGKILSYSGQEKVNYFPDPYDPQVEFVFLNTCGFLST